MSIEALHFEEDLICKLLLPVQSGVLISIQGREVLQKLSPYITSLVQLVLNHHRYLLLLVVLVSLDEVILPL